MEKMCIRAGESGRKKVFYSAILIILCLFALMLTNAYCDGESKTGLFDKIITKEVVLGKDVDKYPFSLDIREEHNVRSYIFEYVFAKTSPYQHYICSISVAEAGKFIDPEQYEEEYGSFKREYMKTCPDQWKQRLLIDFPGIGRRARWGRTSAGPGGTAFDFSFTTSDGMYDVKILISNLMPDTVESPDLEIEKIAKEVSDSYNNVMKLN